MFIDTARIFLKAGKGGDGCLSFRRERAVPFGGPNGGSGGAGGSIFLEADPNKTTLVDFTYKPHFTGLPGEQGTGKDKHGKNAEDTTIFVPCGTVVYKNNVFFHDLVKPHERLLVAQGGRGGRGNAAFKTRSNTAPRIKEKGEPGEETVLDLELKVIADVGLVGFPNAGKSTLLARISAARPRIADYPFTTLTPHLGVVKYHDSSLVVADIPGLIEGAHEGRGLGMEFLRHIERTKMIVQVIDMLGFEGKTAFENFMIINRELSAYGRELKNKPMIIAMNKADLTGFEDQVKVFVALLKKKRMKPGCCPISAVTGFGIERLLQGIAAALKNIPPAHARESKPGMARYTLEEEFVISHPAESVFIVTGKKVEKLAAMTPMDVRESVRRMQNIFKKMGLDRELKKKGIKTGDQVRIWEMQFNWEE